MSGIRFQPVRVFVVAPAMVSWGLERLIQGESPALELVGSGPALSAARDALAKQPCDVMVVAADSADDFEQLWEFQSRSATSLPHLVVLTGANHDELLDRAILAGARGIVHTADPPTALVRAIEKVNDDEMWIDRRATSRIFLKLARQKAAQGDDPERTKISSLTTRERQTIAAVTGDASAPAKVIAQRLCISEHTLRNHLTSIYSKLELTSRLDLYAYASRHHLVEQSIGTR
ncbi:MAG: response regulator transcription factor [Ramlibacter sp.]|nr:response regulator transcription factor [Ramlibacter sp.]